MGICFYIGRFIGIAFFILSLILGVVILIEGLKFNPFEGDKPKDVTSTNNANKDKLSKKDTEVKDDDVKIEITIKYLNSPKNDAGRS